MNELEKNTNYSITKLPGGEVALECGNILLRMNENEFMNFSRMVLSYRKLHSAREALGSETDT